ncbi:AMP-dependent synthetase/ligase [Streptomyces silvensis]|uniref:Acyl-CoA synthetase n=1 Tax=Streptomyces silvensis TaxID=1765722 RepID=A0A0W7WUW9_9ACTN|nr:AMP-dependent synthetase/ligase [Streptomyces silvensis]KUF14390.1 AMP-dependent synthetase [Streptomyces silvensis]
MTSILRLPGDPDDITFPALLLRNAEDHPDLPALSWREDDGPTTTRTWSEVRREVAALATGFTALGVRRGEHVLMMMTNRPEHWLCDVALVHVGAVPVTVYNTSAPGQIAHIARHSRARFAIVEGARELPRWEPLLKGTGEASAPLERLVVVDPDAAGPHRTYGSLLASGARLLDPDAFEKAWRACAATDPLTVVYTSGTTGDPKGVRMTHRDVVGNGVALDAAIEFPGRAEHLCYLPFAHIAERMLGIYLPLLRASPVHLCRDPGQVAALARELRLREFFGVPRVWEKLAAGVRAALAGLPEDRRRAVEAANDVARAHVDCRERGEEPSADLAAAYREAKEKVLDPVLALAGFDRMQWTASAAAPMPVDVARFWAGFGLVVMDAWGLTETTGVVTANGPGAFRLGSVGKPLAGMEVRVADDGEIMVRGPFVCDGYLRADGGVDALVDADGWFATGDVGRLDDDGFLWITDRKKEIIVTSTGRNVAPALVENALKEHPLVGQALVHGDGRSYLVALLVLDQEMAPAWAAARGIDAPGGAAAGLVDHPAVREEIVRAVEAANARLNRTEQIKRYRLLAEEWGPETGELTPSLKLRRRVIRDRYQDVIEGLYTA